MKVRWSSQAERDRRVIFEYVASEDAEAALRLDELFAASAASLASLPYRGRHGAVAGTRELLPHPNYRLIYEIEAGTVWILALVHAARLWPRVGS